MLKKKYYSFIKKLLIYSIFIPAVITLFVYAKCDGYNSLYYDNTLVEDEDILDDTGSDLPIVSFSENSRSVFEEDSAGIDIEIGLSAASDKNVTVDVSILDSSTADSSDDYTLQNWSSPHTITFSPGDRYETVTIVPVDDSIDEGTGEFIDFALSSPLNAALDSNTTCRLVITDNDFDVPVPNVYFADPISNIVEGDSTHDIEIQLSEASLSDVIVTVTDLGTGSAESDDYSVFGGSMSQDITFPAGVTSMFVTLTVNSDFIDEGSDETVLFELSNPVNAQIINGTNTSHTFSIIDNDGAPVVFFTNPASDASEDGNTYFIEIQLSAPSLSEVDIEITDLETPGDQFAVLLDDYNRPGWGSSSIIVSIPAGDTTGDFSISTVTDLLDEYDEKIELEITSANGADINDSFKSHVITITDDDDPPDVSFEFSFTDTINENESPYNIKVLLSEASGMDVSADIDFTGSTADLTDDYLISGFSAPGTIVFDAGVTQKTISLTPIQDSVYEHPDEFISLSLTNHSNATLGAIDTHVFTIANDDYSWPKRIGGTGADEGFGLAADSKDNIIVVGYVTGSADFDGNGVISGEHEEDAGDFSSDIFVCKFDKFGTFQWANRFGGSGSDKAYSVTTYLDDQILITGTIYNTVDLDGNPDITDDSEIPIAGQGFQDIFVLNIDASGDFNWARRFGGTSATTEDAGHSIKTDSTGDIVITGIFKGNVDFNNDLDTSDDIFGENNLIYGGNYDIFVMKLFKSSGNFNWSKRIGGTDYDFNSTVTIDNNDNIILSGTVGPNANLNCDIDVTDDEEESGLYDTSDIFVSRFNNDANHDIAQRFGGIDPELVFHFDYSLGIAHNDSNEIFITGKIDATTDIDSDDTTDDFGEIPNSIYSGTDISITKFDLSLGDDLSGLWTRRIGGADDDGGFYIGCNITVDPSNDVILVGDVTGDADIDGNQTIDGTGPENSSDYGDMDVFISKFSNNDGSPLTLRKRIGGINADGANNVIVSNGRVFVTGFTTGIADLDGDRDTTGDSETPTGVQGGKDIFVSVFMNE